MTARWRKVPMDHLVFMQDGEKSVSARVGAVKTILEMAVEAVKLESLASRIVALEHHLNLTVRRSTLRSISRCPMPLRNSARTPVDVRGSSGDLPPFVMLFGHSPVREGIY